MERNIASIQVGRRHRTELGDIDELAASIDRDGLLQPITTTPDGVLVCGARRLAAIKALGWKTVNVWVRSGISDRLGYLLAEQDDNVLHKPLTQTEGAALYRELKALMAEDAAGRQASARFSAENQPGSDDGANFAPPSNGAPGKSREQAAAMIPGGASHTTLDKIGYLQKIADDPTQPADLREQVTAELERIDGGAPVHPIYETVHAAVTAAQQQEREADLHQLAAEALARAKNAKAKKHTPRPKPVTDDGGEPVRYPIRAFVLTWTELTEWWTHYDINQLAAELTDEQIESFLAAAEGTTRFAEELRAARSRQANGDEHVPARGHLRAL
nr:ParB N-terminal domain-containing protein [Brachybacterium sacelli]